MRMVKRWAMYSSDVEGKDYEGYVIKAKEVVLKNVTLPPGYHIEWAVPISVFFKG